MKNINEIISKAVNRVINESLSEYVYHFTSLDNGVNIIKNDIIYLTMGSNISDATNNKNLFYLSTQRSKSTKVGYARQGLKTCRLTLDGKKLNYNFKGRPIDYWKWGKGASTYEMEDRLLFSEPFIDNAHKYIIRADFVISNDDDYVKFKYLSSIIGKVIFIYRNKRDFELQNDNYISQDEYNNLSDGKIDFGNDKLRPMLRGSIYSLLAHLVQYYLNYKNISYYKEPNKCFNEIRSLLKNFELSEYSDEVIKYFISDYRSIHDNIIYNCHIIGDDLRKLGFKLKNNDGINIMRLGAYILKCYKINNFDELGGLVQSKTKDEAKKNYLYDTKYNALFFIDDGCNSYKVILHPDKTSMSSVKEISDDIIDNFRYYIDNGYVKIGPKTKNKNKESFINYFKRLWNKGSINDLRNFLSKVCVDSDVMYEVLGYGKFKRMKIGSLSSSIDRVVDGDLEKEFFEEDYIDSAFKLLKQHPELNVRIKPKYPMRPDIDKYILYVYDDDGKVDNERSIIGSGSEIYYKIYEILG